MDDLDRTRSGYFDTSVATSTSRNPYSGIWSGWHACSKDSRPTPEPGGTYPATAHGHSTDPGSGHAVLGVEPKAMDTEIKRAYRHLTQPTPPGQAGFQGTPGADDEASHRENPRNSAGLRDHHPRSGALRGPRIFQGALEPKVKTGTVWSKLSSLEIIIPRYLVTRPVIVTGATSTHGETHPWQKI